MKTESDPQLALIILVCLLGAVALAREGARHLFTSQPLALTVRQTRSQQADALRDGRPIDLNRATQAELQLLPGVGPAIAARIVAARTARGGFVDLRDLLQVKGIGTKTLEKIRPFLAFGSEQLEHTAPSQLNAGRAGTPRRLPEQTGTQVDAQDPGARGQVVEP